MNFLSDILAGVSLTAVAIMTIYIQDSIVLFDNLDDGSRPNIDFEVNYAGIADNVELYGKTHWDIDEAERGEITVGASFKF